MVESMETLALFIGEKEFYDLIVASSRSILVNIGLNLMKTTK